MKKGKPVGESTLVGYELDFGAPRNALAAANAANYQVAAISTRRVKKKVSHIVKPITNFVVTYVAASEDMIQCIMTRG